MTASTQILDNALVLFRLVTAAAVKSKGGILHVMCSLFKGFVLFTVVFFFELFSFFKFFFQLFHGSNLFLFWQCNFVHDDCHWFEFVLCGQCLLIPIP